MTAVETSRGTLVQGCIKHPNEHFSPKGKCTWVARRNQTRLLSTSGLARAMVLNWGKYRPVWWVF